jgi:hypothetical protein
LTSKKVSKKKSKKIATKIRLFGEMYLKNLKKDYPPVSSPFNPPEGGRKPNFERDDTGG